MAGVCKTVGSAYVGSNPTPATRAKTAPWAAETRPGGPFHSCRIMYQVRHRGSMRGSGYGHIANSVRAKRAVRITAPPALARTASGSTPSPRSPGPLACTAPPSTTTFTRSADMALAADPQDPSRHVGQGRPPGVASQEHHRRPARPGNSSPPSRWCSAPARLPGRRAEACVSPCREDDEQVRCECLLSDCGHERANSLLVAAAAAWVIGGHD